MKTLSTRELRIQIGQITSSDLPIVVTNHGKSVFILESADTMKYLYELQGYDPLELHRQLELVRGFLSRKFQIPLQKAVEDEEYARDSAEGEVDPLRTIKKGDAGERFNKLLLAIANKNKKE